MAYGPQTHPEVLDSFREGYLWDALRTEDPALAGAVAAQSNAVIVRGEMANDSSLNYWRDTIGLLTCLLDHGGVAIFDAQSLKWWSRDAWRAEVFAPAAPEPGRHVVILVSPETDGTHGFHTRGLRKFGRPDLSLHHVSVAHTEAVTDLFNRLIELQALGGTIPEGQPIRMAALPEGMHCVHGGELGDPDFNNVHVEIRWP